MESRPAARVPRMHDIGSRPLTSLYVAGPFSMGYVDFFTFLMPLYGLSLGLDASEIGVLVGARSMLALFLSIHIGVLMDRFGTRAVTLVFVWTGMALAPLFPLATGFWALLFLQLVNGAAVSFAWSGVQTLIAQLAEGDGHHQEGRSADRHGQRHALQHAARHHPPAHRHVVERKGERAESSVKNAEQETSPRRLYFAGWSTSCLRHTDMQIATARPSSWPVECPPFLVVRRFALEHTTQKN